MTQELVQYAREELAHGVAAETITATLVGRGYTSEHAAEIIALATNATPEQFAALPGAVKPNIAGGILVTIGFMLVFIIGIALFVVGVIYYFENYGPDWLAEVALDEAALQADVYQTFNGGSYIGFCESLREETDADSLSCQESVEQYRVSLDFSDQGYFCIDSGRTESVKMTEAPTGLRCE